jgi:hypothetical protein
MRTTSRRPPLWLSLAAVLLAACSSDSPKPPEKNLGAQAADIASDTEALRAANAAAGEVVRAAGDCEAVKAALPEANRRLDEIEENVRTATGRTTLAALRKRVGEVAELCP